MGWGTGYMSMKLCRHSKKIPVGISIDIGDDRLYWCKLCGCLGYKQMGADILWHRHRLYLNEIKRRRTE